jgi:hypothetical protein
MKSAARRQERREDALVAANQEGEKPAGPFGEPGHRSTRGKGGAAPAAEIVSQRGIGGAVSLAARSDDEIPGRLVRLELQTPELAESPPETIAGHRGRLKFRNDQSHPRVARRVVRPDHVQMFEAAAPAMSEAAANVGRAREPMRSRQARRGRQEPPCFDGSETVSRLRPFLRRRERTARPHRVAMRARKPCLLIRRLLRGRYDGFMRAFLQSEPGKLVRDSTTVKPRTLAATGSFRLRNRQRSATRVVRVTAGETSSTTPLRQVIFPMSSPH